MHYYVSKLTAQAAQNLLLAVLFVVAGSSGAAAFDLSSLFIAILVPAALFGPIGGAIVDRIGPSRGYAIGSVLRFLPALAAATFLEGGSMAWVIAFAYSAASQVFTPSELALVRTISAERSGRMHSWLVALQYGGQGLGMLVFAPALYFIGGFEAMRIGAAVAFALLIVSCVTLYLRMPAVRVDDRPRSAASALSYREVGSYFRHTYGASFALAVLSLKTLVSRAIVVALPFYLVHEIGANESTIIYLATPGILGIGIGLLWSYYGFNTDSAVGTMRLSLLGMAVGVFALAAFDFGITAAAQHSMVPPLVQLEASINTTFVVAVPVAFLMGIVLTTSLVAARAVFTETAPAGQQARVFAVQETFSEIFVVLPLLAAGVGIEVAGARPTLAVIGLVTFAVFGIFELIRMRSEHPVGVTEVRNAMEPTAAAMQQPLV